MAGKLLDACFLIDLLADDDGAVAKLAEISDELLLVPTLTYVEVGVGLEAESAAANQFETVMDDLPLIAFDAEAARRAVDLQRSLYAQGEPIGAVDVMLAGQALARDASIITRNVEEFARTPVRVSPY